MSLLAMGFPVQQKKEVSLALGLLWIIWGTTNSWRAIYGKAEFYRPGAAMHSLIGGCGICGFWNLAYWLSHTTALRFAEVMVLTVFAVFAVASACYGILFWHRSSQNHHQSDNKCHRQPSAPLQYASALISKSHDLEPQICLNATVSVQHRQPI